MPSFSAVHDQELRAPARKGRMQNRNIRPDARCESGVRPRGGEETEAQGFRANFCRYAVLMHTGNAEETFREYLYVPKSMANMMMDLQVHAPAARQRNFAGTSRHMFRHERRLGVCDALYGDPKTLGSPSDCMGCDHVPGVSRTVPHHGERSCRTRRLRYPPQQGNTTRSYPDILRENPRNFAA